MATFISYAIVRHRLMDIRLVVARTVSYSLLLTLLVAVYAFSMFFISSSLFPVTANGNQLVVSAFLALIIAFTFQPLRRWLENVTDRFFFKERYNPEFLLGTLSRLMASTLLLNEICQGVLKEISEKMKISRGALVLAKSHQGLRTESVGYSKPPFFKFEQAKMLMEVATQPLILEELPEGDYHLEEERRLFYVGMTRARDALYVTASNFYGEGKREKKLSPFIAEVFGEGTL